MDDPAERVIANRLIKGPASTNRTKVVTWHACLEDRQHGYELEAWSERTGECWRVRALDLYTAALELAAQVGYEWKEG
jgi:hypothetical protein